MDTPWEGAPPPQGSGRLGYCSSHYHLSLWGETAGTTWFALPLIPPLYSGVWKNFWPPVPPAMSSPLCLTKQLHRSARAMSAQGEGALVHPNTSCVQHHTPKQGCSYGTREGCWSPPPFSHYPARLLLALKSWRQWFWHKSILQKCVPEEQQCFKAPCKPPAPLLIGAAAPHKSLSPASPASVTPSADEGCQNWAALGNAACSSLNEQQNCPTVCSCQDRGGSYREPTAGSQREATLVLPVEQIPAT